MKNDDNMITLFSTTLIFCNHHPSSSLIPTDLIPNYINSIWRGFLSNRYHFQSITLLLIERRTHMPPPLYLFICFPTFLYSNPYTPYIAAKSDKFIIFSFIVLVDRPYMDWTRCHFDSRREDV